MNTSYIKYNDNNYVVATSNGRQFTINANCDEITIEELLQTENSIERLQDELKELKKEKNHIEGQKKLAKILNYTSLISYAIFAILLHLGIPSLELEPILLDSLPIAIFIEIYNISSNGIFSTRFIKESKIDFNTVTKEAQLDALQIAEENIKKIINYEKTNTVITSNIKPIKGSNQVELVTYKVRKLTK